MPKVSLKKKDSKKVGVATFEKDDFMAVKLKSGKTSVVHKLQGEKLIKDKKATEVKDVELEERRSNISKVEVKKK